MTKNFDETVRLQFEIRGERLQEIAEGASSPPRLASSSAASFPGRNECPGIHCSLREQTVSARSATEFEIRGKMEERTERESDRRREMADLLVLPIPAKWRRLQRKNLSIMGLLKSKEWPQREQLVRTPEPPLPKGTEPSVQSIRS